jgi:molybdenum cofactor cytidylyltransferase
MVAEVEGIILAAGLSSRMGVPKVLLDLNGEPLVLHVVKAATSSRLSNVILVLDPEKCRDAHAWIKAEHLPVTVAVNPHPETGMSSSLKKGIAGVAATCAGAMILLADQPSVSAEVIDHLLEVFGADPRCIVVPTIEGRRTTPVIFPAILFPELLEVTGDVGGRDVIRRHQDMVQSVEMGSRYDDVDLDTPEDVARFRSRFDKEVLSQE